jgi:hypothetical protein
MYYYPLQNKLEQPCFSWPDEFATPYAMGAKWTNNETDPDKLYVIDEQGLFG